MKRLSLLLVFWMGGCDDPALQAWEEEQLAELVMSGPPPAAIDNPVADDPLAAEVGRCMFHDTALSFPSNGAEPVSCNTCHDLAAGGHDDRGTVRSLAADGSFTKRNSPSLLNIAWRGYGDNPAWGWDGKQKTLWRQNQVPLTGSPHGGDPLRVSRVVLERYGDEYTVLFGAPPALPDEPYVEGEMPEVDEVFANAARMLEAYERTLESRDSAFDRAMSGDRDAMTEQQWTGAKVFIGKGFCNKCHNGPALSDNRLHNIGVPQASDGTGEPDETVYLTPMLRGVSQTSPYMHNGSVEDMWAVLEFYAEGGQSTGIQGHSELLPRNLSKENMSDLEAFMGALDGVPLDPHWISGEGCPE